MKTTKRIGVALVTLLILVMSSPLAQAFYNPAPGRWLSRDPIEEQGGHNLSIFVRNDTANVIDPVGLTDYIIQQEGGNVSYQDYKDWTGDIGVFENGTLYVFGFGGHAHIVASAQTTYGGLTLRNRSATIVVEVNFSCTSAGNVLASSGRVYRRDPRFGFGLNPAATHSSYEAADPPAVARVWISTLAANGNSPRVSVSFESISEIRSEFGQKDQLSNSGSIVFKCVCNACACDH